MMKSQHDLVANRFGPVASAYATSSTHSDATVLADLVSILSPNSGDVALDIATGAGNLALALAPCVHRVVALDITPEMLEETARRAKERGLANVETVQAPAESLPFPDASFDIVAVRTAPHHFADIRASVAEMARVVRSGGKVLIVDTTAPEEDSLDEELNRIEKLRDPSHCRNYKPSEWRQMVSEAGLTIQYERCASHALGKRMMFSDWTERMKVPPEDGAILRNWLLKGSPELMTILEITEQGEDFSFTLPEMTILATKV